MRGSGTVGLTVRARTWLIGGRTFVSRARQADLHGSPDSGGGGTVADGHSRVVSASSAQRRMYFSSVLRPDSSADIWGTVLAVEGNLLFDRLERALTVLAERHETLRTTFLERGGEVLQVVHPAGPVAAGLAVAPGESPGGRRAWAETEARKLIGRPFDLASGPLWRAGVIRVSDALHLLVFAFHHIIIDEVSAQVFAEDLRLAYADPDAPGFTGPAAQYADFCLREKALGVDRAGLDHWRDRLAGVQPTRLPEDGGETAGGLAGARLPIALPEHTLAEFEAFCRERSVTPFTGLLAVYFVLLQRWTGTADLAVGTPVLNRSHSEFFRTIGFFANTVVLRCRVTPSLTFDRFLDAVVDTVHDALEYQDVPFEVVVDEVAPHRDADRNPLFQAAIGYGSLDPGEVWALDGLRVSPVGEPAEVPAIQFDLTLDIQRLAGGTTCTVEYDRRRFSAEAMRRFAGAYAHLLAALTRSPGVPMGSVPLLDERTLAETLALGAGEAHDAPPADHASAWDLFARTAAATPDREAVAADGEQLTFGELAGRARTMAAALRARGVRLGTVVGICLPRRGDLIAAMLATWCAGGAFLLLDPQQPVARRRLLLEDPGVSLVVADEPFSDVETVSAAVLLADAAKPVDEFAARPGAAPAYVVFTSGSTGQPKGVLVDHASVVALATTQLTPIYARLPAGRQANIGGLSSVTFDVFVNQCLGMIAFGHRLLLIGEEERMDPVRLLARGADPASAIDLLDCNSSQMEVLVDAGLPAVPHPPKILVMGGESASDRLWRRLHEQPGLVAFNMYGITECTVDSAVAEIGEHPRQVAGRAAGTSRLYVVDDQLQLLPPLFVGEICIGGLGVAQGYVGRPAQTGERFVADPFSPVPGQRMYRTGDRGRLRPDGQLEFWGRVDDQVKVRGLRVEPGEVEAALLGHPAIARAAVFATDPGTRAARLVACVLPAEGTGAELTPSAVREFLRGRLPAALLPDRVAILGEFPVTPNGKLDRKALSAIEIPGAEPEPASPAAPPGDPRVRQLCEIVAEVVGVPHAGPEDNFFDLGGNSLLAMTVIGRVRTALGCSVRIRAFFEAQSIGEIADRLGADDSAPRPALRRRGDA
ncbi:amino acid adenylation domain-containing protein [Amycolatopsis sp. A133]|uniref:non-ribosomal peptide synthetase n=1 Tax=Amycolatopsis sp. A133 TaxID=3064472 RepID=UPI0027F316BA|nr:amino acid adenylation domain-containing protein [Amycolatopsis sp. A133]MDQ7807547.1 amino acid adenylation domain-containing protein [Amycolatopsis sp. A133]